MPTISKMVRRYSYLRVRPNGEYVYFIREQNRVKIGYTMDIYARMKSLQTKAIYPLELLFVIKSTNAYGLEEVLHKRFADLHLYSEWFTYGKPIKDYIGSKLEMDW
jgi:hypothetical protein